jgi:hypothetical protein
MPGINGQTISDQDRSAVAGEFGSGCRELTTIWLLTPEGAIAQLGERLLCKQEVVGSIPSGSTRP